MTVTSRSPAFLLLRPPLASASGCPHTSTHRAIGMLLSGAPGIWRGSRAGKRGVGVMQGPGNTCWPTHSWSMVRRDCRHDLTKALAASIEVPDTKHFAGSDCGVCSNYLEDMICDPWRGGWTFSFD